MKPPAKDIVNDDELLTIQEAHQKLGGKVSVHTLYLAIERKKLAHYRVSGTGKRGRVLIRASDLLAWLEQQRVAGREEPIPSRLPARPTLNAVPRMPNAECRIPNPPNISQNVPSISPSYPSRI